MFRAVEPSTWPLKGPVLCAILWHSQVTVLTSVVIKKKTNAYIKYDLN